MYVIQLSQRYRATTRRQFTFTFRSPVVPNTHLEIIKPESTLEPLTGFEPRTP